MPLLAAALYQTGLGLWLVRLPVVLAAAALVWLAVRFARLLGGSTGAAALAGLACAMAPMLIGSTGTLDTSAFDPPAWTAIAFQDLSDLAPHCREVVILGTTFSPFAMAYENGKSIALCRGLTKPLAELWPQAKHFE